MKKFLAVIVAALVIALALWVAMRVQQANRQLTVTELLPQSTLFLAHVPDFKRTREQWHASDLYALWREPAVQTWLQEPLAQLRKDGAHEKTLHEFWQLEPQNGFIALTSLEENEPRFIAGFYSAKAPEETRRFIEEREAPWLSKSGSAKRETLTYQEHRIETVNAGRFALATVYDRGWFFASNHLASLEALLDRADRRGDKAAPGLREKETFQAAAKHFSSKVGGTFYFEPQPFLKKLQPLLAMTGQSVATRQLQRLEQVRSISGALGFEQGKMREMIFVAMPRQHPQEKLLRSSLGAAGPETFFYSASLAHWSGLQAPLPSTPPALPEFIQRWADALARAGVSAEDLRLALGEQLELVGQWPANARWPILLATLPVKDGTRARKIADALTSIDLAGAPWSKTEKNGVSYYNSGGFGGFFPLNPVLAISNELLIAGSDSVVVEAAITRQTPPSGPLEKSKTFRDAAARLPAGDTAFNYIDARLLFERADAVLRPLLLMSATVYPALGNKVDASKLPPAEAIAKHLSPIVMTQRYTDDGYLSESIGPVTFNEAAIALAAAMGSAYIYFQRGLGGLDLLQSAPVATPSATPTTSPP